MIIFIYDVPAAAALLKQLVKLPGPGENTPVARDLSFAFSE